MFASISSSFLLENSLALSFGVCFFVIPFWLILCICFYELDRSVNTLVQSFVRCCLWLALDNLFGAISYPLCMASSAEAICVQKEPGSIPRPAFTSANAYPYGSVTYACSTPALVLRLCKSDLANPASKERKKGDKTWATQRLSTLKELFSYRGISIIPSFN